MTIEERVQGIFNKVLDIKPEEIKPDEKLNQTLGVDSTEMVEIVVGLKKEFGLDVPNNEFKKTQSFNEIAQAIRSIGVS